MLPNMASTSSATKPLSRKGSESDDINNGNGIRHTKFSVTIYNAKEQIKSMGGAEITVKEFLDFLKTAYQVHDSLEGMLIENGMPEAVDWIKLKESELVKPRSIACQTSEMKVKNEDKKDGGRRKSESTSDADLLKQKLSEVLMEGLLDSVLPYLVPANAPKKSATSVTKSTDKSQSVQSIQSNDRMPRRKSSDASTAKSISNKVESEVEIHVCDEVKNIKKNFFCNQKLLVEQMGYFAEVTAGQKLEDMDISVHCDIGIFEWLMRWVKRDQLLEGDQPVLDSQCAIPVLVSAAFLQMEPLLADCLLFCHEHMNEILKTSTSMSCLNDTVLTRLAAMYTNTEIESVRDRKDKIQSRLFCKLIQSLCEPEAEAVRGHYSSLARVYKCSKCQQIVSPSVSETIPCIPPCMRLQPDGSIISKHVRDPEWSITEHVSQLQKMLKTWRRVYWRLWGDAHFLYCTLCKRHFPAKQIGWCRYHPDLPQYFTLDAQRAPLPMGRYPCCGERAYRFQPIDDRSGCQFREHTPCTKSVRDASILAMLEMFTNLVAEEPPQLIFPERLTRLVARDPGDEDGKLESKEVLWWDGLEIVPPRPKLGLLGGFGDSTPQENSPEDSTEEQEDESDEEEDETTSSNSSSSSTSSSPGSEECIHNVSKKVPARKRLMKKKDCRQWQNNLSARSNQDIQRAYEEQALKQMTSVLDRRTMSTSPDNYRHANKPWSRHTTPLGGIWVRLESDWRENYNAQIPQRVKNIYTGKINKVKPTRLV